MAGAIPTGSDPPKRCGGGFNSCIPTRLLRLALWLQGERANRALRIFVNRRSRWQSGAFRRQTNKRLIIFSKKDEGNR
jgi:hypothetical protein